MSGDTLAMFWPFECNEFAFFFLFFSPFVGAPPGL